MGAYHFRGTYRSTNSPASFCMSRSCLQSHRASHEVGRARTRDRGPRQTHVERPGAPPATSPARPVRRRSNPQPAAPRTYLLARPRERRKEVARPRAALLDGRGVASVNASGSRRLFALSSTSGTRKSGLFLASGSTPAEASVSPPAPPLLLRPPPAPPLPLLLPASLPRLGGVLQDAGLSSPAVL